MGDGVLPTLQGSGALAGVKVLEFGTSIASAKACMMLADNGADVIKVESVASANGARRPGYYVWNRGKRCLLLDLDADDGLAEAYRLLDHADVAVFDETDERLRRRGLDPQRLESRHPSLLIVSMPPFGLSGPLADLPAEDILLGAATGVSAAQFSYAHRPVHLVIPLLSYGQGMVGAAAIAAAVYERRRSGRGQRLVVSGLHGVAIHEGGTFVGAGATGRELHRAAWTDSRGQGYLPTLRLYCCADGKWLLLAAMSSAFVVRAFMLLGLEDLLTDPRFVDGIRAAMRVQATAEEVERRMASAFRARTRDEWLAQLAAHDVPAAPVNTREEWFASEQIQANEMRLELADPEVGPVEMAGLSLKFSESPGRVRPREIVSEASWLSRGPRREPASSGAETATSGSGTGKSGPLADIVVLDLGQFVAGPVCSTVLADFGATVIKVEPPQGDEFRAHWLSFVGWNRGKRSLSIDLKRPSGLEAFYELVRRADVVVDNYRPGVAERLGIDYSRLAAINPRIVTCSISGYGPIGPLADQAGFDPALAARSGMQDAQGGGQEPVFLQMGINDTGSGAVAAFGVIAGLLVRDRTGRGQKVETCLANQSVLGQSGEFVRYVGAPAPERGGRDCLGRSPLYRFYRCRGERWIALACNEPLHYEGLCTALHRGDWSTRYPAETAFAAAVDSPLASEMAATLAEMAADDAVAALRLGGVPCAQARHLDRELLEDPHLESNGFWQQYEGGAESPLTLVAHYAQWSRTQADAPALPPPCGQHSIEILREIGLEEERIMQLLSDRTIRQPAQGQRNGEAEAE